MGLSFTELHSFKAVNFSVQKWPQPTPCTLDFDGTFSGYYLIDGRMALLLLTPSLQEPLHRAQVGPFVFIFIIQESSTCRLNNEYVLFLGDWMETDFSRFSLSVGSGISWQ